MRFNLSMSLLGALVLCAASAHAEDRWVTETRCSGKISVGSLFFISLANPARVHSVNHSEACTRLSDSTLDSPLAGSTPVARNDQPRFGISASHKGFALVLNLRF